MAESNIVVGLDLGTTKSRAIVGERDSAGVLKIIGVGVSPSGGLRKGVVVDVDASSSSSRRRGRIRRRHLVKMVRISNL